MYVVAGAFFWYGDLIWVLGHFGFCGVVGGGGDVDVEELV